MALKVGETGKIFRVSTEDTDGTGYDMSSYTELSIKFNKPDGTSVTKTYSGGEVTLGTGAVTDADLGDLAANEYVEYDIEAGFLDQAGAWTGCLTYTNTASTPDDVYIGDSFSFTVSAAC